MPKIKQIEDLFLEINKKVDVSRIDNDITLSKNSDYLIPSNYSVYSYFNNLYKANNYYRLDIIEYFTNVNNNITLKFSPVNQMIFVNNVLFTGYTINNNIITFNSNLDLSDKIEINYTIKDLFFVNAINNSQINYQNNIAVIIDDINNTLFILNIGSYSFKIGIEFNKLLFDADNFNGLYKEFNYNGDNKSFILNNINYIIYCFDFQNLKKVFIIKEI